MCYFNDSPPNIFFMLEFFIILSRSTVILLNFEFALFSRTLSHEFTEETAELAATIDAQSVRVRNLKAASHDKVRHCTLEQYYINR